MSTIYSASEFVDSSGRLRSSNNLLTALWRAFQASRGRRRIRAQLYALNDCQLADMSVCRGEIEHIALSQPSDRVSF
jgi:uncharacterized protein YjiS (DUF1127 family)